MSQAQVRVRELAGWGLDESRFRPALYRGSPGQACAIVAARAPFEAAGAALEPHDSALEELLAAQRSRADLHEEMKGLEWSLGLVDLRRLLAFQRRIVVCDDADAAAAPADDWAALAGISFAAAGEVDCEMRRCAASVEIRTQNPNLHVRFTDDCRNLAAVHAGSPFFEVAEYRGRWFLRDGYHRAFRCLRVGITRLPAVIVRARTVEELGTIHPWFFPEEVLFSSAPPRVTDFLDDALVLEYNRSPLIRTLRIRVEENDSLEGEEL